MSTWRLAWLCGALVLGGCAAVSRPAAFPRHYALATAAAAAPSTRAHADATLRIARVSVPAWLDGTGMYYRLAYRADDGIAAYADSDWVAPPADMLEVLLRNTLAAGAGWRAVVGPGDPTQSAFTLQVRIDDFSQVFASPQDSVGRLAATVTLLDGQSDKVIAQRPFRIEVPAPGADAAGGVAALNRASRQFADAVRTWLDQAGAGQRPRPAHRDDSS